MSGPLPANSSDGEREPGAHFRERGRFDDDDDDALTLTLTLTGRSSFERHWDENGRGGRSYRFGAIERRATRVLTSFFIG